METAGRLVSLASEIEIIIANIAMIACNTIGILVLLVAVIKGVNGYLCSDPHVKLKLAKGIAMALEFKLAGEVLRTITVRDWSEFAILGAIMALRVAITLLIHWEIKAEKSELALENTLDG